MADCLLFCHIILNIQSASLLQFHGHLSRSLDGKKSQSVNRNTYIALRVSAEARAMAAQKRENIPDGNDPNNSAKLEDCHTGQSNHYLFCHEYIYIHTAGFYCQLSLA